MDAAYLHHDRLSDAFGMTEKAEQREELPSL